MYYTLKMNREKIIIFDGVCNFCNKSVNFIIKRDPNFHFMFAPYQAESTQKLLKKYDIQTQSKDTLILIKDGKYFTKSDTVLEIIKELSGFWYLLRIFKFLPKNFRDYFYDMISRNRYKLYGKKQSCMVPTKELEKRFYKDV